LLQIRPHRRKLGTQLRHLSRLGRLGTPAKRALDGQGVFSPGRHLALELELVDRPQLIGMRGSRADLAPRSRRREGCEQCRPQRRDNT
jgi:hypothetical protein